MPLRLGNLRDGQVVFYKVSSLPPPRPPAPLTAPPSPLFTALPTPDTCVPHRRVWIAA